MARLPSVGSDSGTWGEVLNEFLEVAHSEGGINKGPVVETGKTESFTVATTDNGTRMVATAEITITMPSVGTLGDGFECEIVNDSGGSVTIDGPGTTNVTMADGEVACVLEVNSKQRVVKGASVVISSGGL